MKLLIDLPEAIIDRAKGKNGLKLCDIDLKFIGMQIADGIPITNGEFLLDLMQSVMTPEQLNEVLQKMSESPKGEWGEIFEYLGYNYHKCSNCCFGIKVADYDNFCPNCGADMRDER